MGNDLDFLLPFNRSRLDLNLDIKISLAGYKNT